MFTTLSAVFDYADAAYLDEPEEALTIAAAKAGDEDAALRLVTAYGPALRSAVSRFKGGLRDGQKGVTAEDYGTPSASLDDVQQTALLAFFEALAEHDAEKNPRLAGSLSRHLNRALADEATGRAAFAIPERTLSRFYGILREADGDVDAALALAPARHMTAETFLQVLSAVQSSSLDAESEGEDGTGRDRADARPVFAGSPVSDAEDAVLVEVAFSAVEDDEERICRLSYGFTEYDPQPDAEVAHRMGLSRPAVQRKRAKALGKMRKTLGVADA